MYKLSRHFRSCHSHLPCSDPYVPPSFNIIWPRLPTCTLSHQPSCIYINPLYCASVFVELCLLFGLLLCSLNPILHKFASSLLACLLMTCFWPWQKWTFNLPAWSQCCAFGLKPVFPWTCTPMVISCAPWTIYNSEKPKGANHWWTHVVSRMFVMQPVWHCIMFSPQERHPLGHFNQIFLYWKKVYTHLHSPERRSNWSYSHQTFGHVMAGKAQV